MAKDNSADLMRALLAKLYLTITGDDENIKTPRNKFVSWLLPGIPFVPEDFRYCVKGFNGATAEEVKENYQQAFVLSKFLDFVPDVSKEFVDFNMQQTIFTTTQDTISSVYRDVLNYSRVLNNEISDTEKEKLQKYRDLMEVIVEEENIITGEKEKNTKPGKITLAYMTKMIEYLDAVDEYMNLKIDAMSATGSDPEAKRRVHEWTQKSRFLLTKVNAARMAWVTQGYKNEYEQMNTYIDQVTRKSLVLYKQDLINKFENSIISGVDAPADFYYTTLFPANFTTSLGWTKFRFYANDYEYHYNKKVSKWGGGGGLNLGLFSIGASAGGSKIEVSDDQKANNFSAEFEFTQVQILRPWFDPGFFFMRSWTLDNTWDLTYDKKVSDGKDTPTGRLVAYPITALFVRNLKFKSDEWKRRSDYVEKTLKAGGSVSYGPFNIGGSYSSTNVSHDVICNAAGGAIEIPGIQLIGFINNLIPKSPNLNPEIKPEQLVGG